VYNNILESEMFQAQVVEKNQPYTSVFIYQLRSYPLNIQRTWKFNS